MANFGKKILAAFIEVTPGEKPVEMQDESSSAITLTAMPNRPAADTNEKFRQYFDQLFSEANIAGPDYYEFSKMTDAMSGIPDEKSRFVAAFAGLKVQGLDKQQLLTTAAGYLKILEQDASSFNQSVDVALQEKVAARQEEISAKQQRIEQLNMEIINLQNNVHLLQLEIKESEEKITSNTHGYQQSSQQMKERIVYDINRIEQYINS